MTEGNPNPNHQAEEKKTVLNAEGKPIYPTPGYDEEGNEISKNAWKKLDIAKKNALKKYAARPVSVARLPRPAQNSAYRTTIFRLLDLRLWAR